MEGRVINYSDIVHNFCVQIWVGRVGGEGNLDNDNKYRVFSRDSDLGTSSVSPSVCYHFV